MKVTIIGAGKVGTEIARRLSEEGLDIVIIDRDEASLAKIEEKYDCLTYKGTGSSSSVLKSPAVDQSQLIVAVTNSDEVNMIACMTAKRIGIPHTIARIRNPEYHRELIISKEDLGIDLAINPDWSAAEEINRLLSISLPVHMEPLAGGKVQLIDFTIDENHNRFINKTLRDLELPPSLLVVAISRKGNMIIPGGQDIILPGDVIYILGLPDSIRKLCLKTNKKEQKIHKVTILGGGRISFYLADSLCKRGIRVKIIEKEPGKCRELAEQLPDALIIEGDGSDLELLKKEGIKDTHAFVAATGLDEENLLLSLLAKQMGAQRVIAKVSRPGYAPLVEKLGVDAAISPRLITIGEILRFIRGGRLLSIVLLLNEQAEVIELRVQPGSKISGRSLIKSGLPKRTLVGAIIRHNKTIIPQGNDVIVDGDRLVIFTMDHNIRAIENLCGLEGSTFE